MGPSGLDDREGDGVAHWIGGSELEFLGRLERQRQSTESSGPTVGKCVWWERPNLSLGGTLESQSIK